YAACARGAVSRNLPHTFGRVFAPGHPGLSTRREAVMADPIKDARRAFDELISKRPPQPLKQTDNPTFNGLAVQYLQVGSGPTITNVAGASDTLDFPNTGAQDSSDLTITVPGAQVGDCVAKATPAAPAKSFYDAFVSAPNTVTVRFCNFSAAPIDP